MEEFKPKRRDLYSATIKHFGSEPKPAFEEANRQTAIWGRKWGTGNDVGKLRTVLMHRPGSEFDVIDRSKKLPICPIFRINTMR